MNTPRLRRHVAIAITLCGSLMAGHAPAEPAAAKPTGDAPTNLLQGIDTARDGETTTLTLHFRRPPRPEEITEFVLLEPPRLVVDFHGAANASGVERLSNDSGILSRVALVSDGARSRLQADLDHAFSHRLQQHGERVEISLRPLTPEAIAPAAVAGDLDAIEVQRDAAGRARITLGLPTAHMAVDIRQRGQSLVIDIPGARLPASLRRRQALEELGTAATWLTSFPHEGGTRLVIDARGDWRYVAYQRGRQLTIELGAQAAGQPQLEAGTAFTGAPLSMHFQDVDVRTALQTLADFTGLNLITSDSVSGRLTMHLKNVPWDQALHMILQARGLEQRRQGDVIWIAPREQLRTEAQQALEQQARLTELEPLHAEVFQLSYQRVDALRRMFGIGDDGGIPEGRRNALLSRRGNMVVDPRTNQLFVTDTADVLAKVRKMLVHLDIAARQVLIEARIIEADDRFGHELGARLGLRLANGRMALGNTFDDTARASGDISAAGDTTDATPSVALDLAARPMSGAVPGTIALALFNASTRRLLNLELSALESAGRGQVVASPRVITADQQAALIEQGEEIPYQQSTKNGGTSTSFKKANLKLEVTPRITPDGHVILDVDISKDSRGARTPGGLAINTKHVKTQVRVEDGGTVVIGGIFTEHEDEHESRVPLLGDIPLLGRLFRHNAIRREKTELLIFLTPQVVDL